MEGLATLLFYALIFYFLMRFGCGAHLIHGHNHQEDSHDEDEQHVLDPVCGKEVNSNQGYGIMYKEQLYRFCSRRCLEQFDEQPALFTRQHKGDKHEH